MGEAFADLLFVLVFFLLAYKPIISHVKCYSSGTVIYEGNAEVGDLLLWGGKSVIYAGNREFICSELEQSR